MPILSKVAKKVLTIPASSAKSEKVFSTGGNFVTKKRNRIAPKKVEELIIIKENKEQLEDFKENGGYEISRNQINPFKAIQVDQIIQDIFHEENMESEDEEGDEDEELDDEDEGDFENQLDDYTEDEDSSEDD